MPDAVKGIAGGDLSSLDVEAVGSWVEGQRWYASKSRHVTAVELMESIVLSDEPPLLVLALLQARFSTGTHELYQLPLGVAGAADVRSEDAILATRSWAVYDALAEPAHGRELLRRIDAQETIDDRGGRVQLQARGRHARSSPTTWRCGRSAWSSRTRRSCSATSW